MEFTLFISSAVGPKLYWDNPKTGERQIVTFGQLKEFLDKPGRSKDSKAFNFKVDHGKETYAKMLEPSSKAYERYREITFSSPDNTYGINEAKFMLYRVIDLFDMDHKLVDFTEFRSALNDRVKPGPLSFDALFPNATEYGSYTSAIYRNGILSYMDNDAKTNSRDLFYFGGDRSHRDNAILRAAVASFIANHGLQQLQTRGVMAIAPGHDDAEPFTFNAIKGLQDGSWIEDFGLPFYPEEEGDWPEVVCCAFRAFGKCLTTNNLEAITLRKLCHEYLEKVEVAYFSSQSEAKRQKVE